MNNEKVKEIKKALEDNETVYFPYIDEHKFKLMDYADILTLINELEKENESLRNELYRVCRELIVAKSHHSEKNSAVAAVTL